MADVLNQVGLTAILMMGSLMMTAGSIWAGARLAPWFLQENLQPPSLRSFFFEFDADSEFNRVRAAVMMLAVAVMLAGMVSIALTARAMGWQPSLALGL